MKFVFGAVVVAVLVLFAITTTEAKSFQQAMQSEFQGVDEQQFMQMSDINQFRVVPQLFRKRRSPQLPDAPMPPQGLPAPPGMNIE